MFTFELAERRPDLVVNALHPATLMDTKMARETFGRSRSTVAEGVEATARVVELEDVVGPLLRRPARGARRPGRLRRRGAAAAVGRLRRAHVSSTPCRLSYRPEIRRASPG